MVSSRAGRVAFPQCGVGFSTVECDRIAGQCAFGSGFMGALLLGKPISEAIEWGRRQGASVVKYIGAKKGLLTINELLKEGD